MQRQRVSIFRSECVACRFGHVRRGQVHTTPFLPGPEESPAVGLCAPVELPLLSGSQRFHQAAHDFRRGQGLLTKVGPHLFEVSPTFL